MTGGGVSKKAVGAQGLGTEEVLKAGGCKSRDHAGNRYRYRRMAAPKTGLGLKMFKSFKSFKALKLFLKEKF